MRLPVDAAVSCSLAVLLLDLLLKFRMTTFRLGGMILGRTTASAALFSSTSFAQINHAEYAPSLAVLMMALRYVADQRDSTKKLSRFGKVGCYGSALSWCAAPLCPSPCDRTGSHWRSLSQCLLDPCWIAAWCLWSE